jgi:predicted small lipoprotein YifL
MKTLLSMVCITGLLLLGGCGQKGDLYHAPEAPPPEMEQAAEK